eukprot:1159500-Pelagomonas_calceolata.AAC.30
MGLLPYPYIPQDYFRIRLILALLEGCGQYFGSGPAGARLDRFLTFFQETRQCVLAQILTLFEVNKNDVKGRVKHSGCQRALEVRQAEMIGKR